MTPERLEEIRCRYANSSIGYICDGIIRDDIRDLLAAYEALEKRLKELEER